MALVALRDHKLWFPETTEIKKRARANFTLRIYEEKACSKCEYIAERHSEICDECPAFKATYQLWERKKIQGAPYIGLPVGDKKLVKDTVQTAFKVKRIKPRAEYKRFRHDIEFTGKLWDAQIQPVKDTIKAKRGVLLSPPRSGKTVMAVNLITRLRYRTLILASQVDWLKQFMATFKGSKTQAAVTNVADIEKFEGRKLVGLAKTVQEMKSLDVAAVTYQTFLSEGGQKKLEAIRNHFGVVITDEVQDTAADGFLGVIAKLNPLYMIGLTGTYDRKDQRIVLPKIVLGPVVASGTGDTLRPVVRFVETGVSTATKYKTWTYAERWLADNEKRNALICQHVLADLKAGRSIVIPVTRVAHARILVAAINKAWQRINKTDELIAHEFTGQLRPDVRDRVLERAKKGKIRVIVGIRKILQKGINVPRWDTLYEVMPISNPPNLEQETARIRTRADNKKYPTIKHFIENFGISKGCLRTCVWQTYRPLKFKLAKEDMAIATRYMSQRQQMFDSGPTIKGPKLW